VSGIISRIRHQLDDAELRPLTKGGIIAELTDAVAGSWSVIYEFDVDNQRFRWVIDGASARGRLVGIADAARTDIPTYPITRTPDMAAHLDAPHRGDLLTCARHRPARADGMRKKMQGFNDLGRATQRPDLHKCAATRAAKPLKARYRGGTLTSTFGLCQES
jgi:hypothetical protein